MPIATPSTFIDPNRPWFVTCAYCDASLFNAKGWRHSYRGVFHGQIICDPQLAREAKPKDFPGANDLVTWNKK
jgi:hypothetical protein